MRCDRYDPGIYTSTTNHVIVLKCPNASEIGRHAAHVTDPGQYRAKVAKHGLFLQNNMQVTVTPRQIPMFYIYGPTIEGNITKFSNH